MKFSVTFVFSLLFLVVLGCYVYLIPVKPSPVSGEAYQTRLLPLEKGDRIVGLLIDNDQTEEPLSLQLEGDQWKLVRPVEYPADPVVLDGLVTALRVSSKARRLKPEKDWSEYGLAHPSVVVGIDTLKGVDRKYLYMGDASPLGGQVFAKWRDEDEYFLLDPNLKAIFDRTAESYKEKRIFRVNPEEITKIRVKALDLELELSREDSIWLWLEPVELLGNEPSKVELNEMMTLIRSLYVKDFIDQKDPGDAYQYGFHLPTAYIKIWTGSEQPAEVLWLGNEVKNQDAYYAKREGDDTVFLVSRSKMGRFFEMFTQLALGSFN